MMLFVNERENYEKVCVRERLAVRVLCDQSPSSFTAREKYLITSKRKRGMQTRTWWPVHWTWQR
jgi:hypothetical protein